MRSRPIILVCLILCALVTAAPRGASADPAASVPEPCAVPDLVGRSLASAESALLGSGVVPWPSFVPAPGTPAWTVVAQELPPGKLVKERSFVRFDVALPASEATDVPVPSLFGLDAARARQVLASLGLASSEKFVPSAHDPGIAFSQAPRAGTLVTRGTTVAMACAGKVLPGWDPERLEVPDLAGLASPQAHLRLIGAGLRGRAAHVRSAGAEVGHVVGQEEVPGTRALPGSTVTFLVPTETTAPDVVGGDLATAIELAARAGLLVRGDASASLPGATVIAQDPAAGRFVATGSVLGLRFAAFAGGAPVVVGPTPRAPRFPDPTPPAGGEGPGAPVVPPPPPAMPPATPPAGELPRLPPIGPGAFEPLLTTVPTVTGLTLAAAQEAIRTASLVSGTFTGPAGSGATRVLTQSPAAGTRVARGSRVDGTYSRLAAHLPPIGPLPLTPLPPPTPAPGAGGLGLPPIGRLPATPLVPVTPLPLPATPSGSGTPRLPAAALLVVPRLLGLSVADARARLAAEGFVAGDFTGPPGPIVGTTSIVSQDPAAGTLKPPGTRVSGRYASLLPVVSVPDVVGLTPDHANAALSAVGLVGRWTTPPGLAGRPLVVTAQSLAARSRVLRGLVVTLTVAAGAGR